MSMLSEPRRKQKWSLNPRGNLWSKDDAKFGKKLLEKMGWEEGKGLGATNQGMVDPIMLRSKDDQKGVGYTGHDDVWLDHQNDFDAILKTLNVENSNDGVVEESKVTALEEASKNGKKRVHYRKFTRGKDLSQYSAVDLGCILGTQRKDIRKAYKEEIVDSSAINTETESSAVQSSGPSSETDEKEEKKIKKDKKKKKKEVKEEEESEDESDVAKISFAQNEDSLSQESPTEEEGKTKELFDENGKRKSTFLTLNRGSMNAYFEQKMAAMKLKLASGGDQQVKPEEEVKIKTEKPEEKKKKRKRDETTVVTTEQDSLDVKIKIEKEDVVNVDQTEEKKSKKKRKREIEQQCDVEIKQEPEEFFFDTKGTRSDESEVCEPKKKSKKSKSKQVSEDDDEQADPPTEIKVKKEPEAEDKQIGNADEESSVKDKKKKKKRKEMEASLADEPGRKKNKAKSKEIQSELEQESEMPEKKKKSKRKANDEEPKKKSAVETEEQPEEVVVSNEAAGETKGRKKKPMVNFTQVTPSDAEKLVGFKGAGSSVLKIKGYGNHQS